MPIKKQALVEKERGKPIADVLIELFAEHGTQEGVAQALGVSQGTISLWVRRAGLEFRTQLVKPESEVA